MDLDGVEETGSNMDMGGRYWGTGEWGPSPEHLDTVFKGKGKGKYGKGDGMYGNGGFKGGWVSQWNPGKGLGGKDEGKGKGKEGKGKGKGGERECRSTQKA